MTREYIPSPPVVFEIDSPPTLLVVSQRDRIAEVERVILSPGIADDQKDKVEAYAEATGPDRSALVIDLGGISLFPPAVCHCSAKITIEIATHEWGHTYLFFFPLGAHYDSSPEMVTINEVVVSIVAEEIAEKISARYGWEEKAIASADPSKGNEFDFDEEMGKIRRRVDQLLAQGKIEEAEAFMEEKRIFLCEHSHCLRKLNQAYFVFHGSYEGGAAGEDPIPGQLRALRSNCNSLREFLERVREVSSYQEFQQLLEREGIR